MGKRIVIIGPAHPYRGGIAAGNDRLAQELELFGHEVHIETFSMQYPKILFPGKTQFSNGSAPDNIKINRSINSINPITWLRLGKLLKNLKPDLLIFRYWIPFMAPCFGTIARRVRKNKVTKIFCIVDNIIPHERRVGDSLLTKYFVKPFDGFIAMSQNVYDDLQLFAPNAQRRLSPHPMFDNYGKSMEKSVAKMHLQLHDDYSYLLFFGFIRDYKGLDLLLNAFAKVVRLNDKLRLLVAGEFYCDEAPYTRLIQELNIADKVILKTNFIPNDEVASYFCAADLVVQPYKSATQSGVTQIAYHFNKPMLVTNVGGIPEIVPNGKVGYVTAVHEEAIAAALVDFYENTREAYFVEHILEEKKRFTWAKMVETIIELFHSVSNQ